MKALVGTGKLLRLALRIDRVKLPITIVAVSAMLIVNAAAIEDIYGSTEKERIVYASQTAPSVVSRVFGGPVHGPEIESIILNETFLFTAIAVAFMSTLAVVRHTRQDEETGRSELIGSAVTGHQASMTAALLLVIGTNIILGGVVAGGLAGLGLQLEGSLATGGALAMTGIVFGVIASLTAQLSSTSRGANSLAAIVIGVAFIIRAIGDSTGSLVNNGLGVDSNWPSWFSPLGWGQQIYPFTENNWMVFGLFVATIAVLGSVSYLVNAHRDQGLGLLPERPGPPTAKKFLTTPLGLAWYLQKGVLRGWAITMVIMGTVIGFISEDFREIFESNPDIAAFFGESQSGADYADFFFAAMLGLMSITLVGYVVQALLKMRSEEATGRLEPVLSTALGRIKWMMSHVSWVVSGSVLLIVILGLASGISFIYVTGSSWSEVPEVVKATLVHTPALLAMIGFVVMVFGLLPRFSTAVSWTSFALIYFITQFATILELPQYVLNFSPFEHTPAFPLEDITLLPISSLIICGALLGAIGFVRFRNRDITTN